MPMEMGAGRRPEGWILVAPEGVKTKRQLEPWVRRSLAFVETLPPKERARALRPAHGYVALRRVHGAARRRP